MSTIMTIFTATLVQDSALSVSGIDRESTSDQPFAMVGTTPVLSGRGLKGAAVAMARRCFVSLPGSITEGRSSEVALYRSAWEIANAYLSAGQNVKPVLRAGVGILQKTGARAGGVLYDREVMPAGTRWDLQFRVDWRLARKVGENPAEVEGILGYVLQKHWAQGRCWLGGGVARGLGWCHLEDLETHRLSDVDYERWVTSKRTKLPERERRTPMEKPTRSWCFRTLDLRLEIGEHQLEPEGASWGLDMLAIGPHSQEIMVQPYHPEHWARPSWAGRAGTEHEPVSALLDTDRAIAMEGDVPLLPGSSLRGPLRHAFSRWRRTQEADVNDPHLCPRGVPPEDPAGRMFGTMKESSQLLIRDGHAAGEWFAARMHMHAEDELSAGSYGNAKRDAVRLLRGRFELRLVVEGSDAQEVSQQTEQLDQLVALGALGHLPVGGHKTHGAGSCRWRAASWRCEDVKVEADAPPRPLRIRKRLVLSSPLPDEEGLRRLGLTGGGLPAIGEALRRRVEITPSELAVAELTLGEAVRHAKEVLGGELVCWWCEPRIDLEVRDAPMTFGRGWPTGNEAAKLRIDEVVFLMESASWRAARTTTGWRAVLLREVDATASDTADFSVREIPARLHTNRKRFAAHFAAEGTLMLREWWRGDEVVGYMAKGGV